MKTRICQSLSCITKLVSTSHSPGSFCRGHCPGSPRSQPREGPWGLFTVDKFQGSPNPCSFLLMKDRGKLQLSPALGGDTWVHSTQCALNQSRCSVGWGGGAPKLRPPPRPTLGFVKIKQFQALKIPPRAHLQYQRQ